MFLTQISELVQDLDVLGKNVSDERLPDTVIQGLTSDYELQ